MEQDRREEELFAAALNLPIGERDGYIARACDDSPSLQTRLTSLLRVVDSAFPSKNQPLLAPAEAAGDRVGNYKLVEEIGEGGCGVVYLAEQVAPVRREVAIKIIRLGMDSKDVLARFEAERQVLALMDHPNIAKVLDAGSTASGRPYFVMELVRGIKITDYCNQVRLPIAERVALLMQVCQAIQHAHDKGVVHRDIKPSNVLITLVDGLPLVKVIDFGIAKATQGRLTHESLLTAMDQFVGTPAYVSPEQTELGAPQVGTRSDIYSLGVLLYELLTGCLPLVDDDTAASAISDLSRRIREEDPVRPSLRVTQLSSTRRASIAQRYRISSTKLSEAIRGDLDWIVMRCLEKQQEHRYSTANHLRSDLERYLRDEPVVARPHRIAYVFLKFARRNRLVFTTGMTIIVILAIATTMTTRMAIRAQRANDEMRVAYYRMEASSRMVEELNRFMRAAISVQSRTLDPSLFNLDSLIYVAGTAPRVRFAYEPLAEAAIRDTLGAAYNLAGDYAAAQFQFERALSIYRREVGIRDRRAHFAIGSLVRVLAAERRYAEAERLGAEALAIYTEKYGALDGYTLHLTPTIGFVLFKLGKFEQAKALLEPGLKQQLRLNGSDWMETLAFMPILAAIYAREGQAERAEQLARTSLEARKRLLGPQHPETIKAKYVLQDVYALSGRYLVATDLLLEASWRGYEIRPDGLGSWTECAAQPLLPLEIDPERPASL